MWETRKQGAVDIVSGSQPVNKESVDSLRRALESCAAKGQPRLVFDCSQVPLFDSAGLELLLDVRDACRRRSGRFQLAALNPLCADILKATGLFEKFEISADTVSAAGSFAR